MDYVRHRGIGGVSGRVLPPVTDKSMREDGDGVQRELLVVPSKGRND